MRVRIDRELCQGHARCYSLVPEVFDLDEEGRSLVHPGMEVPAALERRVLDAIANCPERAITWK